VMQYHQFPLDLMLQVLHSRTNWSRIHLPFALEDATKASAFAPLNRTDFELCVQEPIEAAALNQWLANPHLTALSHSGVVPETCFTALQGCSRLTRLVQFEGRSSLDCECRASLIDLSVEQRI
jgi:hypothetical protein